DPEDLRVLAFEEYRLRRQAGETPSLTEYQERFGGLCGDWSEPRSRTTNPANDVPGQPAPGRQSWYTHGQRSSVAASSSEGAPWARSRLARGGTNLPEVGDQFLDFQLIAELGQGAFGKVFLARQGGLANRYVALKIARGLGIEAQTLARLQHTHIVPIYSVH